MSYQHIRSKVVKTRKPHRCVGCLDHIPVGEKAENSVSNYDGELQNNYFCLPCSAFYKEHVDDEFSEGEFREYDNYKEFKENFYLKQIYI